jgi:DNA-directed RNA polymerase specialized sigma24 family protein
MTELLNWEALPAETQEIAAMLLDGWTYVETARLLGYSESIVTQAVSRLRCAMLEQLAGADDGLSLRLTARADELAGRARSRAA